MATCSGSIRWEWSSSPTSICTTSMRPLNLLAPAYVGADRHAVVVADVGGLVGGEDQRLGDVDPPGADADPVVVQGDGAALGETAAVVGELGPDLVVAGGQVLGGVDDEFLHAEQVVDEPRPCRRRSTAPSRRTCRPGR